MGVEITGFPDSHQNPFAPDAIKASIAKDFERLVPAGHTWAVAIVATPEGGRLAVAAKKETESLGLWQLSVDMGVKVEDGKVGWEYSVKLLVSGT